MKDSNAVWRGTLSVLAALLALFWCGRSAAHDLAIDRLTLWVESDRTLRGQLLFDPELTRAKDAPPTADAERRALEFVRTKLAIEVDGRRLAVDCRMRELWVPAGATPGDSVMLELELPQGARALRVRAPDAMKALVVTVQTGASSAPDMQSTLILGGQWTPAHPLAAGAVDPAWRSGGPEQFSFDAGTPSAPAGDGPATPPRSAADSAPGAWQQAGRYVWLGIIHILPYGWDHVLFVAGLVLGSGRRLRPLLIQLSAFTLAHSITLAFGALGWIVLPGRLVEVLIAASIAVVALENVVPLVAHRYRVWVVLCFGLLHGQGFARVLGDLALPRQSFLVALLSFNVGVELGQLLVVAALLLACLPLENRADFERYVVRPGSVLIGVMGLYWVAERLLGG